MSRLEIFVGREDTCKLLMRMYTTLAIMENSVRDLQKLEMQLPNNASVQILAVKGVIEISGQEPSTTACLVHLYSQQLRHR